LGAVKSMLFSIRARVALITASVCLAVPAAGVAAPHKSKFPSDYAAWSRVAHCEEGGWSAPGGFYPDALGINATNYRAFGGHPDHGRLSVAQRIAEIKVADRLIHHYGVSVPDQGYCRAW
jgi:hypothetical protein